MTSLEMKGTKKIGKKYVLIVPDGAADVARIGGKSPLQLARKPYMDKLAILGITGLMQSLYTDLPKGSIVAQLGMLGYDPYIFYPNGRASCEAIAIGKNLHDGDIAFRANFVYMKGDILESYNAWYIKSDEASKLILFLQNQLSKKFPEFEIYHNSDFRNTLILRQADVDPRNLICPEPHENMGTRFNIAHLVKGLDAPSEKLAKRINLYLISAKQLLSDKYANGIFVWSPSKALNLPKFYDIHETSGDSAVIGHMDFLHGIAISVGLEFFKLGNGDWNTDYSFKGSKLIELLKKDYHFVYCHINAPDEASHMGDLERKVYSIEQIDQHIVGPVFEYFQKRPGELGGVIVSPDHYTNHFPRKDDIRRSETHSIDPVPFLMWNGSEVDESNSFSEADVVKGKHGQLPIT